MFERLFSNVVNWGYSQGINGISKKIHKAVKDGRIKFIGLNKTQYIDKDGVKHLYKTYGALASKLIEAGNWADQMTKLGLTNADVVNILVEEYEKQDKDGEQ